MPEKLYTKMQAAEYLQCSLSTINRRIKTGDLKPLKNGRIVRFTESELERFIRNNNQSDTVEPIKEEPKGT
jgi:excisionase family DNA binding protein